MSALNALISKQINKQLKAPARIFCQTCNTTFYLGPASKLLEDLQRPLQLDYMILAIRHIWNNHGHIVETVFSGISIGSLGYDLNKKVAEQKRALRDQGLLSIAEGDFDSNWMRDSETSVACSICHESYKDLKAASQCCSSQKAAFQFPFQELENWLVRK
jgi:hypothetical protein